MLDGRVAFFAHDFAVLDPIEPGYSVRTPTPTVLTAGTYKPVTDNTPYTDLQAHVVVSESDRIDLDVVEHERQSRLARWHRQ